jgi:hypothetical protein
VRFEDALHHMHGVRNIAPDALCETITRLGNALDAPDHTSVLSVRRKTIGKSASGGSSGRRKTASAFSAKAGSPPRNAAGT